ncbi:mitogen-activated protein kinase [Aureococcus anophagefferens]|nr:mitogen-activated protein kinase [Aureococcus anophagefferens]
MDVTRHNLDEGVALLRKALESPRCEFVAIDEEMTGISFGNLGFREFNGLGDSPAFRYGKMRAVAASFGLVQLGVAAFVGRRRVPLRARVVNCYVFPGERGGRDAALLAKAAAAPDPRESSVVLTNKDFKSFADTQLAAVKRFADEAGESPKLKLEIRLEAHDHAVVRKYLYQEIETKYPSLLAEKRPNNVIAVLAVPPDEKIRRARGEEARAAGLRRASSSCCSARRANAACLVGHNCLFDLLFLLEHLDAPLPASYAEFKRALKAAFPTVVDTKCLVASCPEFLGRGKTDLGSLYDAVTTGSQAGEARRRRVRGPTSRRRRRGARDDAPPEDGEIDEAATPADRQRKRFRAELDGAAEPLPSSGNFHEADRRGPGREGAVEPCEFAEPLEQAVQGVAFHVRLATVDPAKRVRYDDVKALLLAAGAAKAHRATWLADDGTEWLADVDLPDGATTLPPLDEARAKDPRRRPDVGAPMASRKSLITHHDERDRTIEGYLKKKTSIGAIKLERGVSVGADATKEHCFVLRDGARAFRFQADHARDLEPWVRVVSAWLDESRGADEAKVAAPPAPSLGLGDFAFDASRYAVDAVIGHGSYGLVVSATALRRDGRRVAIKRIGRCFSNLLDAKRTLRELRLLHSCVHPNLLDVWDCYRGAGDGGDFDDVYVVMELLATDLHQVIYARQELSTKHVTYFMYQMLSGLRHLHAAGVLHRDLKPGNVLLNESCELKICDFGLARSLDVDDPHILTEYVVTRWYRPPELVLSCQAYGSPVDLWSAGCILGEMVTRAPLFPGTDIVHQVRLVVQTLKAAAQDFDAAGVAFVENAMAHDYVERVQPAPIDGWISVAPGLAGTDRGLDMLDKLLRFDPANRLTAAAAMDHPFLSVMKQELADIHDAVPPTPPVDLSDIENCALTRGTSSGSSCSTGATADDGDRRCARHRADVMGV